MKNLLILTCITLVSACATMPEKLQLPEHTPLISYEQAKLKAQPTAQSTAKASTQTNNHQARWGGTIASIKNLKESTLIEVLHFPLASNARPKAKDETQGRFRLYFSGLLDPMIYKEGRSISAVGLVGDNEQGKIGEYDYNFPVLNAKHIHLWKQKNHVNVRIKHDPFAHLSWTHSRRDFYYQPYSRIAVSKQVVSRSKSPKISQKNTNNNK